MTPSLQEAETVEDWALAYVTSCSLADKTSPPAPPSSWAPRPISQSPTPGRPACLRVTRDKPRSIKRGAVANPETRARLVHKFWHHELQAAELMAWAILRYADTPLEFRRGLLRILRDEVRHMRLYEEHLSLLGHALGDFAVRDWFWERVPTCPDPTSFVALLGMGLEGANLEHTGRFAGWFRSVGDHRGAEIQDQVGREEVAHVRFATRWFRRWTGSVKFDVWCANLPPPLSPLLLRGKSIDVERRRKAEMPDDFVAALARWQPSADRATK